MINPVGSTLSSLSAHSTKINTTAHNVANVNTEEFKKDSVTIQSNETGQPEATITKVETPGYNIQGSEGEIETSNVDLAEEIVNLKVGTAGYQANLKVLKAEDEIWDSVLDILV